VLMDLRCALNTRRPKALRLASLSYVSLHCSEVPVELWERSLWSNYLALEKVRDCQVDDLVTTSIHHGTDHVETESECLLRGDCGWHG
jgi:hypothetical protein